MNKLLLIFAILALLAPKVNGMEFTAPEVPSVASDRMPDDPESFAEGLWSIFRESIPLIQPALAEAVKICISLIAITMLVSLVRSIPGTTEHITELVGTMGIAVILLKPSSAFIHMGIETVQVLSEYGKLLLPVMTAALAAQGGGHNIRRFVFRNCPV